MYTHIYGIESHLSINIYTSSTLKQINSHIYIYIYIYIYIIIIIIIIKTSTSLNVLLDQGFYEFFSLLLQEYKLCGCFISLRRWEDESKRRHMSDDRVDEKLTITKCR